MFKDEAGRQGEPEVRAHSPKHELLEEWERCGVQEAVWSLPDADDNVVLKHLDELATRLHL